MVARLHLVGRAEWSASVSAVLSFLFVCGTNILKVSMDRDGDSQRVGNGARGVPALSFFGLPYMFPWWASCDGVFVRVGILVVYSREVTNLFLLDAAAVVAGSCFRVTYA
ncbi:unnamed protein product [Ectocarpus sp. 8 AP-2014]